MRNFCICPFSTNESTFVSAFVSTFGTLALILFLSFFSSTASALTSDDFNSFSLDSSLWTVVDPVGDSTIFTDGYTLQINVPAGTSHDVWSSGNMAPRVVQEVANTDFEIEAKFESSLGEKYQLQGILVEQDASNFLRFDFSSDGANTRIFAAAFNNNGSISVKVNKVITVGSPMFIRVTRVGNQWTQWYSVDGVTWTQAISFTHALVVETAGVFAGNAGDSPPQHIAVIDYFFNTASPISPEDGDVPVDNIAPAVSNIQTTPQPSEVLISWMTDEPVTSQVNYGETLLYEFGSVSSGELPRTQHEVLVTGLTPQTTYNFQILAQDPSENAGLSQNIVVQTTEIGTETFPQIDLWYGTALEFGFIGTPQKWVNILGNVSGQNNIESLTYSLNDGPEIALSIGPDVYRLANSGDFNIDIDRTTLRTDIDNTLDIKVKDSLGYITTQTVTVTYSNSSVWPTAYSINWASTGNIQNVAQIVDGNWKLTATGVRTIETGYDRLVAIGEISWTDYEVTVPLTVYSIDPAGYAFPSNGPGVGILMGWLGHNDINVQLTQPKIGWRPIGALGWYRWRPNNNERLELLGSVGAVLKTDTSRSLQFGVPYTMKMQVRSNPGQGNTYSLKWWETGQTEPTNWNLTGSGNSNTPQEGSLMLVAHHADVEFGNITVLPLGSSTPIDTVGAVIGGIAEQIGTTDTLITWTTDKPATATLRYGADATYGSTISNPALNTNHSMMINGLLPDQSVHYEITVVDADGNITTTGNRSFVTQTGDLPIPETNNPPIPGSLSDDFNNDELNVGKWTFADPVGDSSFTVNGGQLALSVSGGAAHDVWISGDNTVQVTHELPDEDFFAEIKFDSVPMQQYQLQGLIVKQDNNNFIRFDFTGDGTNLRVFAASFQNGTPTTQNNDVITSGVPLYMRVRRVGDQWTQQYSYDGTSWQTAVSFTHSLTANSVSLFAGNAGGNAPAYTALVDYYWIDKGIPVDITPDDTTPTPPPFSSDEFNGASLDLTQWTFIDPVGESAVNVTNGQLALAVNGGLSHDVWKSGNDSVRVTHVAVDQDFSAEVKFDSIPAQRYQLQGMLVEQDVDHFIRFDFYSDGSNLKIFAATFQAGQPTVRVNATIATGGPLYMRIKREGDQWTQQYSYDGSNWQTAVTFAHSLTIASTSLFGGNAGNNAPAFTALVDYYRLD